MPLVPLVLGLTLRASGSLALGLFLNSSSPLPIKNYFQWWWQRMSGGHSGAKRMFCLALTTMPWSTYWTGGSQRFHSSCNSSTVCCSLRHAVASPFQLNTSQMSTIKSLMFFLVSFGIGISTVDPSRFLPSSCRNWPLVSRTALSCLPCAWPGPIQSQDCSEEVL